MHAVHSCVAIAVSQMASKKFSSEDCPPPSTGSAVPGVEFSGLDWVLFEPRKFYRSLLALVDRGALCAGGLQRGGVSFDMTSCTIRMHCTLCAGFSVGVNIAGRTLTGGVVRLGMQQDRSTVPDRD